MESFQQFSRKNKFYSIQPQLVEFVSVSSVFALNSENLKLDIIDNSLLSKKGKLSLKLNFIVKIYLLSNFALTN